MSLGAGPQGYPDNQKVANFDGPILGAFQSKSTTGGVLFTGLAVSRYGYLSGWAGVGGNPALLILEWGESKTLPKLPAEAVLQRRIMLDTLIANVAQLRIPNLGPWLRVRLQLAEAGLECTPNIVLFGSNRVHPLELIPRNPVLFDAVPKVKGKTASIFTPTDYYAGPINVSIASGLEAGVWFLQWSPTPGVYETIDEVGVEAGKRVSFKSVAPAGAWRMALENTGAAETTYRLSVTPTTSGST